MRCIAIPEATLRTLVEEAEALDQVLSILSRKQVPAVADTMGSLRFALREVGQIYHEAIEDGEEANHVRLRRATPQGRADFGDGRRDATDG
jgi:hypothetical protein